MKLKTIMKKLHPSKVMEDEQGVFDALIDLIVGVGAFAIVAIVIFVMLAQAAANPTVAADGNATQAISELTGSAQDVVGWVPLVIIAAIGTVILGLVLFFRMRGQGRR